MDALVDRIANLRVDGLDQWIEKLREKHPQDLVAICAGSAPRNGLEGGTASYAVYFPLEDEGLLLSFPVAGNVTNIRADCEAANAATEIANELDENHERPLVIYSRCQNLVNAMTGQNDRPRWINTWQRNGWRTSGRTAVEHRDIYENLLQAERDRDISWHFVNVKTDPYWLAKLHDEARKAATAA